MDGVEIRRKKRRTERLRKEVWRAEEKGGKEVGSKGKR